MSENKHAFRLMVIDIEEDKVVVDELCDAIVAGTAKSPEDGEGRGTHNVLSASKCALPIGIAAIMAAEKAVKETKIKTIETFLTKDDGSIGKMISEMLEEDDDGCENS